MPTQENELSRLTAYKNKGKDLDVSFIFRYLLYYIIIIIMNKIK